VKSTKVTFEVSPSNHKTLADVCKPSRVLAHSSTSPARETRPGCGYYFISGCFEIRNTNPSPRVNRSSSHRTLSHALNFRRHKISSERSNKGLHHLKTIYLPGIAIYTRQADPAAFFNRRWILAPQITTTQRVLLRSISQRPCPTPVILAATRSTVCNMMTCKEPCSTDRGTPSSRAAFRG
jgi:hypothetical protein